MISGSGGSLHGVNLGTALPYTYSPRDVRFCFKEKASRAPHAPDICIMLGVLSRVYVRRGTPFANEHSQVGANLL